MFSLNFKTTTNSLDKFSNLKCSAILDFAQEVATCDAFNYKADNKSLKECNLMWVVRRSKFLIINSIRGIDYLKVKTNPLKNNLIEYPRDYFFYDKNDELLIKGRSIWIVYDFLNKRPTLLSKAMIGENNTPAFNERLKKEEIICDNKKNSLLFKVRIPNSYIDENGHMNNSRVMDIYLDIIDQNKKDLSKIHSFQIEYLESSYLNEELDIYLKEEENKDFLYAYKEDRLKFYLSVNYIMEEK